MDAPSELNLMDGEELRPIPGAESYYLVSNMGRVFSRNYRRTGRVQELAQSELTDRRRSSETKYRRVKAYFINKHTPTAVHRLVALAFVPNPEGYNQVNHINGDKGDNRACNLEWCSVAENVRHAERVGLARHQQGSEHWAAILTEQQVLEIRAELERIPAYKGQLTDIGRRYGVTHYTIFNIKWRQSWTHI